MGLLLLTTFIGLLSTALCQSNLDPSIEDLLVNRTTLTKDTVIEYIEMMNKLRQIQQEKFNLPKLPDPEITKLIAESKTDPPDQLSYLFQGDIILTSAQMKSVLESAQEDLANSTGLPNERAGLTSDTTARWTTFPIRYTINTATGVNANVVQAGVNLWQTLTCVTFQRVNSGRGDYIEFYNGDGCGSNIGRTGGRQTISINNPGCNAPAIVGHEIGHALGFWHEQSRYDRDKYVRILPQNIQNGRAGQFSRQSQSSFQTFGYPYDLGSVMHYVSTAFSSNGYDTIETIDRNYMGTIGQRVALSFYDVKNINTAYCNNICSNKLPCKHNGYTDPKNCNVCRCSEPFGGTLCEKAASTASSCGTIDLTATPQAQTISKSGTAQCNWVIKAAPNHSILIQVDTFDFTQEDPCVSDYLEIRYGTDVANTGARMCSLPPSGTILSQTNEAVVMFRGRGGRFALRFRQTGNAPATIAGPQPTTTGGATTGPSAVDNLDV